MGPVSDENRAGTVSEHAIKVLLVDDQPIVADAVRRMLEPETDIIFHYCQEPSEAIDLAADVQPTVILQDLVMPDIDGLTLVRFFRAHPDLKDVPLIVLSSKEEAVTKAEAFAIGANDYLVKLPDRIELVARIRYHSRGYINLLERNEAYEALYKSRQALMSELAQAADYVTSRLPEPLAEGPIRTSWRFFPSAQLGGDCFGYHWIDEENFAIYLLDVCGHGVGSALLSVSVLNVLRSESLPDVDFRLPEKVLGGMNEAFQMQEHNNLYFTMWYGVFNARSRRLRFANGGHPPALLVSRGACSGLIASNFVIGAFPGGSYCSQEVEVPPSADLYIFSDGVYEVEQPDGTMWSLQELQEFLVGSREQSPASQIDDLYAMLQKMCGRQILDDDFSMVRVSL